jgi:hypothetical protein
VKVFVGVLLMLTGCQAFTAPDVAATLQAENQQIIQEATDIALTAEAEHAAVAAEADAAMTEVAGLQQANLVLLATVRAGDPPQQSVIVSMEGQVPQLTPGQRWFTRTGVSQSINDADGCVISPQISFTADVPLIYATMKVFNIEPGVRLSALWEREGTEAFRDSFVLSNGAAEICIWFSISQNDAPLTPGNWAVRLFADGAPLESPMAFVIQDTMTGG